MILYFLEAKMPLVKTFTSTTKEPYPNAFEFKSYQVEVNTIEDFLAALRYHSSLGRCLLKGELNRPLNWESRAGSTDPDRPSPWACFDLDDFPSFPKIFSPEQGQELVDDFMIKLGLPYVDYILQWSASFGVYGHFPLRAHVFVLWKEPVPPSAAKLLLRQTNLNVFESDLTLTKTQNTLRWPLDVTTCQNDKLIFTADPVCNPPSLNHFTGERIVLVKGKRATADFSAFKLETAEQLKAKELNIINTLRKAQNLPERKANHFKLKEAGGEFYLPNPDQATVTGVKEERDFVYLNLNGGDSWGYYHPKGNPAFIYNFKGEPTYKTSELLPEYWATIQRTKRLAIQAKNAGKLFLAFRDFRSAHYFNGWYDQNTNDLTLHRARSERQIEDFMVANGQPTPDAIPIWQIEYDPSRPPIDLNERKVNLFKPSEYMKVAHQLPASYVPKPTPAIDRILRHVVGASMFDHYLNWLAYCWQYRMAPRTAWVFHGVPGTGKGIWANQIVTKLFGAMNTTIMRMEQLEDRFNGHLENCLMCFVDEAQVSDSGRAGMIMSNIKNQITEPTITIRRMQIEAYEVTNHVAWHFMTNMNDAVVIASDDRRFNVGEYQSVPISISDADVVDICAELQEFANRLQVYQVDVGRARTPLMNQAKQDLIMTSQNSADTVADALRKGNLAFFWDALPTIDDGHLDRETLQKLQVYRPLLHDLVLTGRTKLAREELQILFNYNVGNVPNSPHKFTTYLRHHGIHVGVVRLKESAVRGIDVNRWQEDPAWFKARSDEITAHHLAITPNLKVVKAG